MESQFDYEPPTARQSRHREHPVQTWLWKWVPAFLIAAVVAFVIMNWIEL